MAGRGGQNGMMRRSEYQDKDKPTQIRYSNITAAKGLQFYSGWCCVTLTRKLSWRHFSINYTESLLITLFYRYIKSVNENNFFNNRVSMVNNYPKYSKNCSIYMYVKWFQKDCLRLFNIYDSHPKILKCHAVFWNKYRLRRLVSE